MQTPSVAYLPAKHLVHPPDPAAATQPVGQEEQTLFPVPDANELVVHVMHAVSPCDAVIWPTGQAVQALEAADTENLPISQLMQEVAATPLYLPAPQEEQTVSPWLV